MRPVLDLVPHWADATAVIGDAGAPGGTTLLAVHTPHTTPTPREVLAWCHYLLALAWRDVRDNYRIGNVAVYLARHGALVTWRVDELARSLAGLQEVSVDDRTQLSKEFHTLARRAIADDGADPRWLTAPAGPRP